MFFADPEILIWAERLGTMSCHFRLHYIGSDAAVVKERIEESWKGCETSKIEEHGFTVQHRELLAPFIFDFCAKKKGGREIKLITVYAVSPFPNVVLAIDRAATNYLFRCPENSLTKPEKQLCKALRKNENIPMGGLAQ